MILRQIHALPLIVLLTLIAFVTNNWAQRQQAQQASSKRQPREQPSAAYSDCSATATGCLLVAPTTEAPSTSSRSRSSGNIIGSDGKGWQPNGAAGYLLAEATNQKFNQSNAIDATLASVLNRNGPDMRPLRGFTDFDDITLEVAKRAWLLMHHHAQRAVSDRIEFVAPLVEQTLRAANVSGQCVDAALKTMDSAKRLDSWAIQLLSSWGNFPPTGIYEGTFGDIGSFHGCVNVPASEAIGHAHYCTISYRPVLPGRRNYELIVRKEPDELLRLFGPDDAFTEVLKNAQYNHYVYYKYGTCFPIKCSPNDVQRLAKLLGARSILMSGPVKCHSKYEDDYQEAVVVEAGDKQQRDGAPTPAAAAAPSTQLQISTRDLNEGVYIWKPHVTGAQWVALGLLALITSLIVASTVLDVVLNRLPKFLGRLANDEREHCKTVSENHQWSIREDAGDTSSSKGERFFDLNNKIHQLSTIGSDGDGDGVGSNCTTFKSVSSRIHYVDDDVRADELDMLTRPGATEEQEGEDVVGELSRRGQRDVTKDKSSFGANGTNGLTKRSSLASNNIRQLESNRQQKLKSLQERSLLMELINDYSIISSLSSFFHISQGKNDILCINGIRCITMSWIVVTHTMQYNDWSAFARTREIETHLKSLINQPLFNASYLVDTFFLISGLLTAFSSFHKQQQSRQEQRREQKSTNNATASTSQAGIASAAASGDAPAQNPSTRTVKNASSSSFSSRSYLIGRYLRLTPQIMFVAILFILLPLLSKSGGPHWYTMTGEYSENCSQNWWISLFHLQAFYRSNEMCNFVCWWISVDMFYHIIALALILTIFAYGHLAGLVSCLALVLINGTFQASKHYQMSLPPNLLSTIPQTGAMWSEMTLEFFWTPYAHVFPFFMGFYLGYLMAKHRTKLQSAFSPLRALIGWIVVTSCLFGVSYSTYFWVIGRWNYSRTTSTLFYLISSVVWSSCLAWIIVACQLGYGGFINSFLSCKLFIVLGKASYIVYLSHFLVLFTFFGSQNLLLEPTQMVMSYVILGNISLSMLFGSLLCIVYETPWLKTQRRLMKYVA